LSGGPSSPPTARNAQLLALASEPFPPMLFIINLIWAVFFFLAARKPSAISSFTMWANLFHGPLYCRFRVFNSLNAEKRIGEIGMNSVQPDHAGGGGQKMMLNISSRSQEVRRDANEVAGCATLLESRSP